MSQPFGAELYNYHVFCIFDSVCTFFCVREFVCAPCVLCSSSYVTALPNSSHPCPFPCLLNHNLPRSWIEPAHKSSIIVLWSPLVPIAELWKPLHVHLKGLQTLFAADSEPRTPIWKPLHRCKKQICFQLPLWCGSEREWRERSSTCFCVNTETAWQISALRGLWNTPIPGCFMTVSADDKVCSVCKWKHWPCRGQHEPLCGLFATRYIWIVWDASRTQIQTKKNTHAPSENIRLVLLTQKTWLRNNQVQISRFAISIKVHFAVSHRDVARFSHLCWSYHVTL